MYSAGEEECTQRGGGEGGVYSGGEGRVYWGEGGVYSGAENKCLACGPRQESLNLALAPGRSHAVFSILG